MKKELTIEEKIKIADDFANIGKKNIKPSDLSKEQLKKFNKTFKETPFGDIFGL